MAEITLSDIMANLPQAFVSSKAAGLNAVIQFRFTGEGGGDWAVSIKDQKVDVHEGAVEKPNLTLTMAAKDGLSLLTGKLDGTSAYMYGKLKIQGDMGLAMRFEQLFRRPQDLFPS